MTYEMLSMNFTVGSPKMQLQPSYCAIGRQLCINISQQLTGCVTNTENILMEEIWQKNPRIVLPNIEKHVTDQPLWYYFQQKQGWLGPLQVSQCNAGALRPATTSMQI